MSLKSLVIVILFILNVVTEGTTQVNPKSNKETKNLYRNLKSLPNGHFLFGHQDDLAYGVGWKYEFGRSDVKDCTGAYPAVFGWDVGGLEQDSPKNIDGIPFDYMKKLIIKGYKEGGLNTISWHMDNPASKKHAWDTTYAVYTIIPGGIHHKWYKDRLDKFADFVDDLKVGFIFKRKIPILFRPFHEHTGKWFWWGKGNCTAEEYKTLFIFTYNYLVKEKKMNNLLFAYSPDIFETKEQYLEYYPGDDYVDLLGLDDYHDVGLHGKIGELTRRLVMLGEIARSKGKPYAITESGFEAIPQADWWTEKLLKGIMANEISRGISYVLVWRNDNPKHHYAPYKGHVSEADFIKFKALPNVLFCGEAGKLYK
jgi:mannan endo-1,4-beta-mannosidase